MGSSITLFRYRDIDVRVHWTFTLILLFGAFSYSSSASNPTLGAIYGVLLILLLFVCVTLHEFGHALVAQYFGIKVPSITLLPIGGVASLERMPDKPFQEFLIAIAGPLVNFAIALVLLPIWIIVGSYELQGGVGLLGGGLLASLERWTREMSTAGATNLLFYLILMNVGLAIFNLLPAFPMDGGRVLRSVLATTMPYVQATRIAVVVGRIFAALLAFWGVMGGGISVLLVAFFVYVGGGSEREMVESQAVLKDVKIRDALTPGAANLYISERVSRAVELIRTSYQTDYPVLDLSGRFVGVLTRLRMIAALRQTGPDARVVDVMIPGELIPVLPLSGNLAEAREAMNISGSRVVVVREGSEFRGLLTIDDVTELFQVMGANFDRTLNNPPDAGDTDAAKEQPAGEPASV